MRNKRFIVLPVLLLTMLLLAMGATTALGASGAIWTTDSTGTDVNQNVWYPDKYSVYLNGGPNAGASHLAPGKYYIQVTDPSGNRLGKVSRQYEVGVDGRFVLDNNVDGTMFKVGESVLIQLYAATKFTPTPNNGGVYKAWISTDPTFVNNVSKTDNFKVKVSQQPLLIVDKFEDINKNGVQDVGESGLDWTVTIENTTLHEKWEQFLPGGHWQGYVDPGNYVITEQSKAPEWIPITPSTVNLIIGTKGTYSAKFGNHHLAHIIVRKFNDLNSDKQWSVNEPGLPWTGSIQPGGKIDIEYDAWLEPGDYTVSEDTKLPDWVPTTVNINGVPTGGLIITPVTLVAGETTTVDFGNRQLAHLHIVKFYDYNGDGILNGNDYKMTWPVTLEGTDFLGKIINLPITLQDGDWADYLDPGDYTVTEKLPKDPGWTPTRDVTVPVHLDPGDAKDVIFGNRYIGIGGHTHGFWGNNNGEAIFKSDSKYIDAINALPLVDGSGTKVTPFASYEAFAVWNQEATGKNAANMLSCQLVSMVLNATAGVEKGFIDINGYVLVDPNTSVIVGNDNVNTNGVVKVQDLIVAAIQSLQAYPNTISSGPERDYQNGLEKLIDAANQDNARVYLPVVPPTPEFDN